MSGLDQISVLVVGYAAVVVLASAYAALRWRARPPWLDSMTWLLELLAALRVAAGVGSMLSGHRPAEQTAYVGYLIASVCIIPIAIASFRPEAGAGVGAGNGSGGAAGDADGEGPLEEDRGVWSVAVVAVAALAVGVIAVRTMQTL